MIIIRWILGPIAAFLSVAALFSLMVYVLNGDDRWGDRWPILRRQASAALLLWFNIEIWGRVVLILIHWK
jgi:hypothetical protein